MFLSRKISKKRIILHCFITSGKLQVFFLSTKIYFACTLSFYKNWYLQEVHSFTLNNSSDISLYCIVERRKEHHWHMGYPRMPSWWCIRTLARWHVLQTETMISLILPLVTSKGIDTLAPFCFIISCLDYVLRKTLDKRTKALSSPNQKRRCTK